MAAVIANQFGGPYEHSSEKTPSENDVDVLFESPERLKPDFGTVDEAADEIWFDSPETLEADVGTDDYVDVWFALPKRMGPDLTIVDNTDDLWVDGGNVVRSRPPYAPVVTEEQFEGVLPSGITKDEPPSPPVVLSPMTAQQRFTEPEDELPSSGVSIRNHDVEVPLAFAEPLSSSDVKVETLNLLNQIREVIRSNQRFWSDHIQKLELDRQQREAAWELKWKERQESLHFTDFTDDGDFVLTSSPPPLGIGAEESAVEVFEDGEVSVSDSPPQVPIDTEVQLEPPEMLKRLLEDDEPSIADIENDDDVEGLTAEASAMSVLSDVSSNNAELLNSVNSEVVRIPPQAIEYNYKQFEPGGQNHGTSVAVQLFTKMCGTSMAAQLLDHIRPGDPPPASPYFAEPFLLDADSANEAAVKALHAINVAVSDQNSDSRYEAYFHQTQMWVDLGCGNPCLRDSLFVGGTSFSPDSELLASGGPKVLDFCGESFEELSSWSDHKIHKPWVEAPTKFFNLIDDCDPVRRDTYAERLDVVRVCVYPNVPKPWVTMFTAFQGGTDFVDTDPPEIPTQKLEGFHMQITQRLPPLHALTIGNSKAPFRSQDGLLCSIDEGYEFYVDSGTLHGEFRSSFLETRHPGLMEISYTHVDEVSSRKSLIVPTPWAAAVTSFIGGGKMGNSEISCEAELTKSWEVQMIDFKGGGRVIICVNYCDTELLAWHKQAVESVTVFDYFWLPSFLSTTARVKVNWDDLIDDVGCKKDLSVQVDWTFPAIVSAANQTIGKSWIAIATGFKGGGTRILTWCDATGEPADYYADFESCYMIRVECGHLIFSDVFALFLSFWDCGFFQALDSLTVFKGC